MLRESTVLLMCVSLLQLRGLGTIVCCSNVFLVVSGASGAYCSNCVQQCLLYTSLVLCCAIKWHMANDRQPTKLGTRLKAAVHGQQCMKFW
jgi:hypothetical protein